MVAEEDPEMESSIEMTKFDIQNDALNEDPLTIPDHDPSINDEYGDDVFEDPTATPGEADGGNATAEADGGAGEGGGGEDGESDVMDLDDVEEVHERVVLGVGHAVAYLDRHRVLLAEGLAAQSK